jgi:hypothetical protein
MFTSAETKENTLRVTYYRSFNQKKEADGVLFQNNLNIVDRPLECYDLFHIHHHLVPDGLVAEVEPDKNGKFLYERNGCAAGKRIVLKNFMSVDEFKMFMIKKLISIVENPGILMTIKKNEVLLILQKRWPMFEIDEHGAFYADVDKYYNDQILNAQSEYSNARDDPDSKAEELDKLMDRFNKLSMTFDKDKKQVKADIGDLLAVFKVSQENSIAARINLSFEDKQLKAHEISFNYHIYPDAVFHFAHFINNMKH